MGAPSRLLTALGAAALAAVFVAASGARAQTYVLGGSASASETPKPAAASTVLIGVAPSDPAKTESRITLTFNPAIPQFSILSNNANTAVLAFADTRLAPTLTFPGGKRGLIQSTTFAQNGALLTLTIAGAVPLHASIANAAGVALVVTVAPLDVPGAGTTAVPSAPGVHADPGEDDAFEVVPLKYADVSEVVGLLTANQTIKSNDSFTPQEPAFGSAGMQGAYAGGVTSQTFNSGIPMGGQPDPLGQTVDDAVGVDRRLNAIILKGAASRVAKLKQQIARLDIPVSSVVLETVFVELTETGARDLGLNFNNGNNQIGTVAYGFAAGGYPGVANTARSGGVAVNLQAAIYGQIARGNGRIISKPRIAAQSGSMAKIITGDALPILTSIALSGVNAVQQQVQYVNVGVTLQIAPRVSDDGFVTSHVFAEVSTVTGYSQGYPTISQREATTSATVRDGESFVIGGLSQDARLSQHDRLPGLGSVPLLGALLSAEHASSAKTDLYILVTPHVVRSAAELAAALRGAEK